MEKEWDYWQFRKENGFRDEDDEVETSPCDKQ